MSAPGISPSTPLHYRRTGRQIREWVEFGHKQRRGILDNPIEYDIIIDSVAEGVNSKSTIWWNDKPLSYWSDTAAAAIALSAVEMEAEVVGKDDEDADFGGGGAENGGYDSDEDYDSDILIEEARQSTLDGYFSCCQGVSLNQIRDQRVKMKDNPNRKEDLMLGYKHRVRCSPHPWPSQRARSLLGRS